MVQQLLDSVYELEGLLMLLGSRDDLPSSFHRLITAKAESILQQARALEAPVAPAVTAPLIELETPEEKVSPKVVEIVNVAEQSEEEPEAAVIAEPAAEAVPQASERQPEAPKPQSVAPASVEPKTVEPEKQPEPAATVKSEKPEMKPIRFAINDRIRFSRELFSADMGLFDSTIRFVEGLPDWLDVEDYFYTEQEWDPSSREVADFMDILHHHYVRSRTSSRTQQH